MPSSVPAVDYLLDTSVLSRLLDDSHAGHAAVRAWEATLAAESRKLISVVALAELRFGLALAKAANRQAILPRLEEIIRQAERHSPLEITRATAHEYAQLKAAFVENSLPKRLQQHPNKGWGNPEGWTDEFTGSALGLQENDLWQCAQAIERDLTFVCCDARVEALATASGGRLVVLSLKLP